MKPRLMGTLSHACLTWLLRCFVFFSPPSTDHAVRSGEQNLLFLSSSIHRIKPLVGLTGVQVMS